VQLKDPEATLCQDNAQESSFVKVKERIQQDIYPLTEGVQSEYTKQTYEDSFNRFLRHIKVHDLQVLIDLGPKVLEQMIIKYVIHVRDIKKPSLSRGSIQAECGAIYHFCEMNDIILNKKKISRFFPPDESAHDDRLYTDEEKQLILSECNRREKVIILLMVSAGIRIGAISKLKVGHLQSITVNGYDTLKIVVDKYSKQSTYWTTCNRECAIAIKEYLEQRNKQGEGPVKDTSPLIREHCDHRDIFRMKTPRQVKDAAIRYTVRGLLKRSGVYTKRQEVMMSHAFRKNFKTVCEESGMKSLHVEMLMGHKEALVKSYMRPKDAEVIQDYITHAADVLTVDPTNKLKKQVEKLESERSEELKQLKAQLIEYKEFAEKTAAEINDLKTSRGLERNESRKSFVEPNFSNIVNAINELRAKNGQEPVAIVTPQEATEKAERTRFRERYIKETTECPPCLSPDF
jgi:integrase